MSSWLETYLKAPRTLSAVDWDAPARGATFTSAWYMVRKTGQTLAKPDKTPQ